jgi:hypothetical protein
MVFSNPSLNPIPNDKPSVVTQIKDIVNRICPDKIRACDNSITEIAKPKPGRSQTTPARATER